MAYCRRRPGHFGFLPGNPPWYPPVTPVPLRVPQGVPVGYPEYDGGTPGEPQGLPRGVSWAYHARCPKEYPEGDPGEETPGSTLPGGPRGTMGGTLARFPGATPGVPQIASCNWHGGDHPCVCMQALCLLFRISNYGIGSPSYYNVLYEAPNVQEEPFFIPTRNLG